MRLPVARLDTMVDRMDDKAGKPGFSQGNRQVSEVLGRRFKLAKVSIMLLGVFPAAILGILVMLRLHTEWNGIPKRPGAWIGEATGVEGLTAFLTSVLTFFPVFLVGLVAGNLALRPFWKKRYDIVAKRLGKPTTRELFSKHRNFLLLAAALAALAFLSAALPGGWA